MSTAPCPDFDTERLTVRNWAASLRDEKCRASLGRALAGLLSEPVLRHLPDSLQPDLARCDPMRAWIDARAANGTVYTLRPREGGPLLGLLTLAQPAPEDLRIGYLLGEAYWGRGLASELVAGLLRALPPGPGRVIHGSVVPENTGSAKVLLKAGFLPDAARSTPSLTLYTKRA
ncbi:GNAT family N-acetyltransferase [Cognatishimia sp. F0-27]|uniref:GNAT family N-acetyltransferase n=1 Tax=Cognatishimia sp. F0-27 TaxID=2816855 RepID=UPI001D0BFB73|nr:GNAT family N-acetyltransferase [Cognatishimia sp. F0-27]